MDKLTIVFMDSDVPDLKIEGDFDGCISAYGTWYIVKTERNKFFFPMTSVRMIKLDKREW